MHVTPYVRSHIYRCIDKIVAFGYDCTETSVVTKKLACNALRAIAWIQVYLQKNKLATPYGRSHRYKFSYKKKLATPYGRSHSYKYIYYIFWIILYIWKHPLTK